MKQILVIHYFKNKEGRYLSFRMYNIGDKKSNKFDIVDVPNEHFLECLPLIYSYLETSNFKINTMLACNNNVFIYEIEKIQEV